MRNSETIQNVNNWVVNSYDHFAGCDKIEQLLSWSDRVLCCTWWDRKCVVSSYALPGVETFIPCKVWVLGDN